MEMLTLPLCELVVELPHEVDEFLRFYGLLMIDVADKLVFPL